jgi:Na+-driven multidrug efflux pump
VGMGFWIWLRGLLSSLRDAYSAVVSGLLPFWLVSIPLYFSFVFPLSFAPLFVGSFCFGIGEIGRLHQQASFWALLRGL